MTSILTSTGLETDASPPAGDLRGEETAWLDGATAVTFPSLDPRGDASHFLSHSTKLLQSHRGYYTHVSPVFTGSVMLPVKI